MILRLWKINHKGMSLLSLLVTLSLFSGLFLTFNQWGNVQRKSAVEIYQRFQAIQIAENQHQRRFLGLPCESQVRQNQIRFQVICLQNQVSVKYPRGEISL
ncbi:DUF5374 domain-containing protein [Aggregatibacter actinomycetemcomitans]|uniref:DUF5374 domain-containing protein n=1 Tax=Aggregatibacter actinomycetemcomitans TaxID=714 RepID=UPI00197CAC78|nr:DUF5374 domain-containing protein [Aggregatibacter actinomycetemcomitans]MBN6075006.1 DUF5374 domain-containing protein [Aggregatibacter actinomycetemcomitans]